MAALAPPRKTIGGSERNGAVGARPAHVAVGPLAVFDGSPSEAADYCFAAIESGRGARVATANLDFVAMARRDATLRDDLASSSIVVADGAPVAWLARVAGARRTARTTGADLAAELFRRGSVRGHLRVAMYGGEPAIARRAAKAIVKQFPGIAIVVRISPPFRPLSEEERRAERRALREAAPELVLVALGCPKQERLIAEYAAEVPGAVWIGVGGTLDFFAGLRRRAPGAVQRLGLEWFVRLVQEPRRLWRRYLLRDVPALAAVAPRCVARRLRPMRAFVDQGGPATTTTHQPPLNGRW